jgi:hypothetical protein
MNGVRPWVKWMIDHRLRWVMYLITVLLGIGVLVVLLWAALINTWGWIASEIHLIACEPRS